MKKIYTSKRRGFMIVIIVLLAVVGLNGCREKNATLKIGVVGTMTGTQSDLSVSGRRGIEIAVDEINSEGGINGYSIELVVKNDENDPVRAEEIVREFAEEGVNYVIGHYTSGMMLAAYQELEKHEILYLGPTISADSLSEVDDHFIRFIASTKEQAEIINEVALRDGHQKFCVIYDEKNIGFNQSLSDNFEKILLANGGKIEAQLGYETLDNTTVEEIIAQLEARQTELDSVFIIANAHDLGIITQELGKREIELQLYGPLWAHTNDLIRIGGIYSEGVRVVSGIDFTIENDEFRHFQESYSDRYGKQMTFSSVYSYEAMKSLAQVLEEGTMNMKVDEVKDALCKRSYRGLQGRFDIDAYGDNTRLYMMDEVLKNEFKRID